MPAAPTSSGRDESLASSFTFQMNAATSPAGFLADIPIIATTVAFIVLVETILARMLPLLPLALWIAVAAAPIMLSVAVTISLRGARGDVVRWLQTVPFPIDNLNAVLSGSGENFDIHFVQDVPSRELIMDRLSAVSQEAFVIATDDATKIVSARFGIDESKYNPIGAAHRRYTMMKTMVDVALADLHRDYPIALVQFG